MADSTPQSESFKAAFRTGAIIGTKIIGALTPLFAVYAVVCTIVFVVAIKGPGGELFGVMGLMGAAFIGCIVFSVIRADGAARSARAAEADVLGRAAATQVVARTPIRTQANVEAKIEANVYSQ